MNIGQLAARLAKLPRPEGWTDEDALRAWKSLIYDAPDCGWEVLEAATSYQVVRPEDVKHGEWYWVRVLGEPEWHAWHVRHPISAFGFDEIRGPIPQPE